MRVANAPQLPRLEGLVGRGLEVVSGNTELENRLQAAGRPNPASSLTLINVKHINHNMLFVLNSTCGTSYLLLF